MHKLPLHDHLHDQIFHPSTDDAATFITRCIWIITVHLILIIGALTHHMCQLGKPRVQNVARKAKQITLCLTPRRPQQYRTVPYLPSCCFHTPSTKKGALLFFSPRRGAQGVHTHPPRCKTILPCNSCCVTTLLPLNSICCYSNISLPLVGCNS